MWRNLAKKAASRKFKFSSESHVYSFSSSSGSVKLPKDTNFLGKFRPEKNPGSENLRFTVLGFRGFGIVSSQDNILGQPILLNSSYDFSTYGVKGYASAAEAIVSTDAEDESSGSDEIQELLDVMNRENKVDSYFKGPKKMVAGMGINKYHMLRRRQVKMETEAWEEAAKEYQELLMDMCEQKLAPNLPYVKSLFLGWFEPLRDAIAADQAMCQEKKTKPSYAPYYDHLSADMMAVITMHKLMGLLMTNRGAVGSIRVVQAACQIGEAIEHEVGQLRIFILVCYFCIFFL